MQIYHLELLPEDCAAIVGALSNHPYRQVAPLIDKIRQQCAEQDERNAKLEAEADKPSVLAQEPHAHTGGQAEIPARREYEDVIVPASAIYRRAGHSFNEHLKDVG